MIDGGWHDVLILAILCTDERCVAMLCDGVIVSGVYNAMVWYAAVCGDTIGSVVPCHARTHRQGDASRTASQHTGLDHLGVARDATLVVV